MYEKINNQNEKIMFDFNLRIAFRKFLLLSLDKFSNLC